ncbi:hypothetical protein A9495_05095 [Brachyspira hampsonii]|nr:hypothetical protein A9495_05095 [Brachyspira hampsonii]
MHAEYPIDLALLSDIEVIKITQRIQYLFTYLEEIKMNLTILISFFNKYNNKYFRFYFLYALI